MIPQLLLTPSAERILRRCQSWGSDGHASAIHGQMVVAALLEESLAGARLHHAGITLDSIRSGQLGEPAASAASEASADISDVTDATTTDSDCAAIRDILSTARHFAALDADADGISSLHLLAALVNGTDSIAKTLRSAGLTVDGTPGDADAAEVDSIPIPLSFTPGDESDECPISRPAGESHFSVARVLDACLNRAREGLRVLEDYARFVASDHHHVGRLKRLRHALAEAETLLPKGTTVTRRDIPGDVGTAITTAAEQHRSQLNDIVEANARRVQEALRSLEEFGKLVSSGFAARMKQLRYESYDVHQALRSLSASGETVSQSRNERRERLQNAQLCVLITEAGCRQPWQDVVQAVLDGGADMLQLREKQLGVRELTRRAVWVIERCREAGALCIVNDRADLARISGADGVHVGQDDCPAVQVREIVGDSLLIGVSTHREEDLDPAELREADYLGAGPVFASRTKDFSALAGLDYIKRLQSFPTPWFAIGGIDRDNLSSVLAAGARRVAVSSAVLSADRPDDVVRCLRAMLNSKIEGESS